MDESVVVAVFSLKEWKKLKDQAIEDKYIIPWEDKFIFNTLSRYGGMKIYLDRNYPFASSHCNVGWNPIDISFGLGDKIITVEEYLNYFNKKSDRNIIINRIKEKYGF